MVLAAFDFYLRIEIMGKMLFLSEDVTHAYSAGSHNYCAVTKHITKMLFLSEVVTNVEQYGV